MKKITFRAMKQTDNKDAFKEWKAMNPGVKIISTKSWNDENAGLTCFLEIIYEA